MNVFQVDAITDVVPVVEEVAFPCSCGQSKITLVNGDNYIECRSCGRAYALLWPRLFHRDGPETECDRQLRELRIKRAELDREIATLEEPSKV